MDLSQFSTDDLLALKAGDMGKLSTDGLINLRNMMNPVDSSVMDANDARARNKPKDTRQLLRDARLSSPVTALMETGPQKAVLGLGQFLTGVTGADRAYDAISGLISSNRQETDEALNTSGGLNRAAFRVNEALGQAATQAVMIPTRVMGGTQAGAQFAQQAGIAPGISSIAGVSRPLVPITQPILTGGSTLTRRALQGGTIGAGTTVALNPVDDPDRFAEEKLTGAAVGFGAGALMTPVAEKGLNLAGRMLDAFRNRAQPTQIGTNTSSNQLNVTMNPTVSGRGGGYQFGTVGDDPSAGITESQSRLVKWAKDKGFRTTPGQESGSRSLRQLEAQLESFPMTSGPFNTIKDTNQEALNRIAARAIGVKNVTSLDSPTLGKAQDKIVDRLNAVADGNLRQIDPDRFLNSVANIENSYEGMLPAPLADNPLVKRLLNFAAKGDATGEQLFELQSRLGKAALNEMTSQSGNRQTGMALYDLQEEVLDLLQQGLSKTQLATFKEARSQYRTLMQLTGRTNVINPSTGNVNGVALSALLQQKDRNGFLFGRNNSDLYNAARFAQAFKPIVGDSGTATRSALPGATDFLLSLPTNIASRTYVSSPVIGMANRGSALNQGGLNPSGPFADMTPFAPLLGLPASGLLGVMASQGQ
jgi:hypothetical protein